jgi:hypothetical protein
VRTLPILSIILVSGCVNLEQKQWEEFSVAHNCRMVSYTAPSSTTGAQFAMLGAHTVMIPAVHHTPARTEYLCNNGVRYTR